MTHQSPVLIGIDWGTSRLRASLLDGGGNVIEQREAESGVGNLQPNEFKARFDDVCKGWPQLPAVLAGMIGSRQGWVEAIYRKCPTDLSGLSANLTSIACNEREIRIIPGLSAKSPNGNSEVMRGEETQIAGLLNSHPDYTGIAVLPGTHSKWVKLNNGRIETFSTFLTGEFFSLLSKQSILSHTIADANSPDQSELKGFTDGATKILAENKPLIGELFSVRTRGLIDGISDAENRAYLSAMTIASEISGAQRSGWDTQSEPVTLIGASALLNLYRKVFEIAGVQVSQIAGSDAVLSGIIQIAQEAGLIAPKDAAQ